MRPTRACGRSFARRRTATRWSTRATSARPIATWRIHYAREFYAGARRVSGCGSCSARRSRDLSDPDLLQPPLDRTFKKPGGYVLRDKLDLAKKRAKAQARGRPAMSTTEHARRPTRQLLQPDVAAFSADALDAAQRGALAELLLTMADDEFVCGFRDSEWTGIAPLLEEDVAFSSLAQDEIGHARVWYEMRRRS